MSNLVIDLDARLRAMADPDEAARAAKYYDSKGPFLGIRPDMLQLAATEISEEWTSNGVWDGGSEAVTALWGYHTHEHRLLAVYLLARSPKPFTTAIWDQGIRWLDETDNWEIVDAIAVGLLGEMVVADRKRIDELKLWLNSDNFWRQRAAVMAMLPLNTGGRIHTAETFDMCRPLMLATEPHVRTAVAWVIREAGAVAPEATAEFLMPYKFKVVNSLLREAARKLPRHLERSIVGG